MGEGIANLFSAETQPTKGWLGDSCGALRVCLRASAGESWRPLQKSKAADSCVNWRIWYMISHKSCVLLSLFVSKALSRIFSLRSTSEQELKTHNPHFPQLDNKLTPSTYPYTWQVKSHNPYPRTFERASKIYTQDYTIRSQRRKDNGCTFSKPIHHGWTHAFVHSYQIDPAFFYHKLLEIKYKSAKLS